MDCVFAPYQGCELDRISFEFNLFTKSEFNLEFFNLIIYEFKFAFDKNKLFGFQVRVDADNTQYRDNFFTAGVHAIKKIKIFRWCSRSRLYLSCLVQVRSQKKIEGGAKFCYFQI